MVGHECVHVYVRPKKKFSPEKKFSKVCVLVGLFCVLVGLFCVLNLALILGPNSQKSALPGPGVVLALGL